MCAGELANSEGALARFWAPDGQLVTNGRVVARGLSELKGRFDAFPTRFDRVRFVRDPHGCYRECGAETVVIEYDVELQPKSDSADDVPLSELRFHVLSVFTVQHDKIFEQRVAEGPLA
jgi:hypothetical protein